MEHSWKDKAGQVRERPVRKYGEWQRRQNGNISEFF
jgi:hypothetical protein